MNNHKLIYRFRQLTPYNLDSLITNRIYASSPVFLNDPLDCALSYDILKLYKMLKDRCKFRSEASSIFMDRNFDSFKSYNDYSEYCKNCFDYVGVEKNATIVMEYIERRMKSIITNIRNFFGIISFSSSIKNPVLWTHYASNRNGFALAYFFDEIESSCKSIQDCQKKDYGEKFASLFGLQKVTYSDESIDCTKFLYWHFMHNNNKELFSKPNFDKRLIGSIINNIDLIRALLLTKKSSWSYENEYRLIIPFQSSFIDSICFPDNDLDFLEKEKQKYFHAGNIKPSAIVFGENMPLHAKALIAFLAKNNDIPIYELNSAFLDVNGHLAMCKINPDKLLSSIINK